MLSTDFGWSKAVLAGPRSITSVQNSILGPITGFIVDRFSPRVVVAGGMTITGLGLIVLGRTNSLWVYYVANIMMALGLSVGGMLAMSVAVNNWFRRKGTLAQSIMLLGFSLAGGVPLLVFLQTKLARRESTALIPNRHHHDCSALLNALAQEARSIRPASGWRQARSPSSRGQKKEGRNVEHSFTLREAVRTRAFWFLAFGWSVISLGTGVVQVHLFLHLGRGQGGVGLERERLESR